MEKEKRPVGRPRRILTDTEWAQLLALIEVCATQVECCGVLKLDEDTLERNIRERTISPEHPEGLNFSEFYKINSAGGKTSLRRLQFQSAQEGSIPMQIWLGKQWLGQKDSQHIDHTTGGQAIAVNVNFDPPPQTNA